MAEFQVIISPRAERDLKAIYAYTLETWSRKQAETYLSVIKNSFIKLLDNPEIGRERPDIQHGFRSLNVGRHIIFYTIKDLEIHVLGVLHGRMDIINYFFSTE